MKDLKFYLIGASLLLLIYIVVEYNQPKPVNWEPSLYYGDQIPFGTYILHRQLPDIFPDSRVINTNRSAYSEFVDARPQQGNYLIIAKAIEMNRNDVKAMIGYIQKGNSVFMSAFDWKGHIADTLKIETGADLLKTNSTLSFTNKKSQDSGLYGINKGIAGQYFSGFDTVKASVVSVNEKNKAVLLRYRFGKGSLFVCPDPELFTNYNLLKPIGAAYAAKALSYMPPTQNIYWDEYQNHDIANDASPIRVFFSYPALQWAYYLSLFSLLLFVLYEVKRRQRVIPIIEPLQNATLDFVKVVGQVYYEKRDNANITVKKIAYLLAHLRDRYRINTNKLDSEFTEVLAQKAGIDAVFAGELVSYINYIGMQQHVNDNELIKLDQLIENFYDRSR